MLAPRSFIGRSGVQSFGRGLGIPWRADPVPPRAAFGTAPISPGLDQMHDENGREPPATPGSVACRYFAISGTDDRGESLLLHRVGQRTALREAAIAPAMR